MRVIVYVPSVRGAIRTFRAVSWGVDRLGHEVVGHGPVTSSAEIRAMLDAGVAEWVAIRPRHLDDLDEDLRRYALIVPVPASAKAALLLPLLWVAGWIRRHPGWSTAGVVGAAVAAALLLAPDDVRQAAPPPARISPTVVPVSPSSTPSPARPVPSSSSQRHTPVAEQPSGSVPRVATGGPTARPSPPAASSPAAPSPTASTASPSPTCLIDLRLLELLHIHLCLDQPSR